MSTLQLLDAAGRRRSLATLPGFHAARPPRNKGLRYPPDPPRVEEIVVVMRQAGESDHGMRLRALIVALWPAPRLGHGRCAPSLHPSPAAPRARSRDGPRRCLAEGDPAPARPRQPRHYLRLSGRDRRRRDHRHRPQPAAAHDLGERATNDLNTLTAATPSLPWETNALVPQTALVECALGCSRSLSPPGGARNGRRVAWS
jgi:hypothetical protein